MNDEVESLLQRAQPSGVRPEMRQQVLDAVAAELAAAPAKRRRRWIVPAMATAASLAVALNIWAVRAADSRMAELYGPDPTPESVAEVIEAVESVTDAETGRYVLRQWTAAWRASAAERRAAANDT